jgi:hypothetical protein
MGSMPPRYERTTPIPTPSQLATFGRSNIGYYNQKNQPRKNRRGSSEESYISNKTKLPKLRKKPKDI